MLIVIFFFSLVINGIFAQKVNIPKMRRVTFRILKCDGDVKLSLK